MVGGPLHPFDLEGLLEIASGKKICRQQNASGYYPRDIPILWD